MRSHRSPRRPEPPPVRRRSLTSRRLRFGLAPGLALGLAPLVLPLSCAAAEAIVTDRPDFVESSEVVGAGRFQIELGYQAERHQADGLQTRTRTTPTLLRLGVSPAVELRLETDGLTRLNTKDLAQATSSDASGWSDLSLGTKWHVQDGQEDAGRPSLAWLLHLDIDSGSAAFRGQGVRPSLRLAAEWDLPHEISLGVMPGVVLDRNAQGQRFANGIFAVTADKAWTPGLHTYLEVAGQQLASSRNGGSVVTLDTGLTYAVDDDVQLDFAVARGLTRYSPDWQWGTGISVRF